VEEKNSRLTTGTRLGDGGYTQLFTIEKKGESNDPEGYGILHGGKKKYLHLTEPSAGKGTTQSGLAGGGRKDLGMSGGGTQRNGRTIAWGGKEAHSEGGKFMRMHYMEEEVEGAKRLQKCPGLRGSG